MNGIRVYGMNEKACDDEFVAATLCFCTPLINVKIFDVGRATLPV